MKKCPYCFTELDDRASICSGCRKRVFRKDHSGVAKKHSGYVVPAILIIAITMFGGLFLTLSKKPPPIDEVTFKKSVEDSLKKIRAKHKENSIKKDIVGGSYNKDVFNTQKRLKSLGYNTGTIDGLWGEKTEKVIKQFQLDKKLPATGNLNKDTMENLEIAWKIKISDHSVIADDISDSTDRCLEEGRALLIKHFNITKEEYEQINYEASKKQWSMPEKSERHKPEYKYLYGKRKEKYFYLDRYSCYELGFRFGRCVAKSMKGIKCEPNTDFVMPERCNHKAETDKGMKAGLKSVF